MGVQSVSMAGAGIAPAPSENRLESGTKPVTPRKPETVNVISPSILDLASIGMLIATFIPAIIKRTKLHNAMLYGMLMTTAASLLSWFSPSLRDKLSMSGLPERLGLRKKPSSNDGFSAVG